MASRISTRDRTTYWRELAAVGLVAGFVVLAAITGAAMSRAEPDGPDLPLYPGMTEIAAGTMPISIRELEYEDARSTIYAVPADVDDVYRFYVQDLPQHGWTLVAGLEDRPGSALVDLTRGDVVAMVQVMDSRVAIERDLTASPSLNVDPIDLEGAQTVVIIGQFRCTDESGIAVCLDYIVQG